MKTEAFKKLFAVLAFCFAASGFTAKAHAVGFWVIIDCMGTNRMPDWAHTNDTITVKAKINGYWNTLGSQTVSIYRCQTDDQIIYQFNAFTKNDVQAISVSTNGNDIFWMDKLTLTDKTTGQFLQWGVNNNQGYCLSKTASHGNNSYCYNGRAYTTWEFK
jgi:hypothetical protein